MKNFLLAHIQLNHLLAVRERERERERETDRERERTLKEFDSMLA